MMVNSLKIIFYIFVLVASAESEEVTKPTTTTTTTTTTPKPINADCEIPTEEPARCNLKLKVSSRVKIEFPLNVTFDDITKLVIENQTMNFMPDNLKQNFSNVIEIQILNSNLKEVLSSDLAPFGELTKLHIIGNEIQEIKADLFSNNPKIEEIDFSRNQIGLIESTAFDNLNVIKKIDLSDNTCISMAFLTSINNEKTILKSVIMSTCTSIALGFRNDFEKTQNELKETRKKLDAAMNNETVNNRLDEHKKSIEVQKERIESLNGESNTIIVIIVFMIIFMMAAIILGTVFYVKNIHNQQREAFNGNINL